MRTPTSIESQVCALLARRGVRFIETIRLRTLIQREHNFTAFSGQEQKTITRQEVTTLFSLKLSRRTSDSFFTFGTTHVALSKSQLHAIMRLIDAL